MEDSGGYPHGLYFPEDNKSWCCLQVSQASWWSSLLRPSRSAAPVSSLREGVPSEGLILCTTWRLLAIVSDICFFSHLQLIRILYRSWAYKGPFYISKVYTFFFFLQETRQKIWWCYGISNFVIVGIFILLVGRYQYLLTASWYIQIDYFKCFYLSSSYLWFWVCFFFSLPLQESVTDPQCLFQDELQCYSLENFLLSSHVSCSACSHCWKEESCAVKMLDWVSHSNWLWISNLDPHIFKICLKNML